MRRVIVHSLHGTKPFVRGSRNFGLNSILSVIFVCNVGMQCPPRDPHSDLQIGVRGRLRVRVVSSEHAHFENSRPPNLERVLSTENSLS